MFIADIENPFRSFMAACGAPQHNIDVMPTTARESLLGSCSFLDDEWKHYRDIPKLSSRPVLFLISVDGLGSKEIYHLWEEHSLTDKVDLLIPDYILNCEKPIIYFDNSAEGHCDEYIFKFISKVVDKFKLNPNTTFYGNSAYNIVEMHKKSKYNNFKTIFTNNYNEQTVASLANEFANISIPEQKKYLFHCLNNAPRPHRALLIGGLIYRGLDEVGLISSPDVPFEELYSITLEYLSKEMASGSISLNECKQGLSYLDALSKKYPLSVDQRTHEDIHMEKLFSSTKLIENLLSCDIAIVTETFIDNTIYFTEKIYKPIIMKQPFIILGSNNILGSLKSNGYDVFEHLYSNYATYDKTSNIIKKINHLLDELETLQMKKDSISWWEPIEKSNVDSVKTNLSKFSDKNLEIVTGCKSSMESWLEIYPGYKDIFNCYY